MSIPPRFLDEIRNRLTLSDIIGRRISVQRAGREFKACCPFHGEKTPSFTINDDKQFYHCFGCGAHGDVIGFVMQHDNVAFPDAVEMLAVEAGLQVPKPDPRMVEKAEKARDLHTLMDDATSWLQAQITRGENSDVMQYLNERGIDENLRSAFRIGFAPADGQALRRFLASKNFTDAQMIDAGVLKKSTRGKESYVFFRERVMFPVTDRRGRVVAFGGRVLPEHVRMKTGDFTPPKYINSSDTPLFDKGRMLYGESIARQASREGHTILVTEGYMDVIACHKYGFKGAVAPMGTALTEDQILSLFSMVADDQSQPILCFDGDNAGRKAAARACENILPLLKPGRTVRFAFMPDGEDPDSLLRSVGASGFKKFLSASLTLFDFLWYTHTAGRNFETPESRAGLSKTLYEQIGKISDQDIQRHYKELVRNKISDTFFKSFERGKFAQKNGAQKKVAMRMRPMLGRKNDIIQRILLATVINQPVLYSIIEEEFGSFKLSDNGLSNLRSHVIDVIEASEIPAALDGAKMRSTLEERGFERECDEVLNPSVYVHASFARPITDQDAQDEVDFAELKQNWLVCLKSLNGENLNREVKDGWKNAFENENEEQEDKLRNLHDINASE